jgi:hypothetical protein
MKEVMTQQNLMIELSIAVSKFAGLNFDNIALVAVFFVVTYR